MGYPGEYGQPGGRPSESYDPSAHGSGGLTDARGAGEATTPREYEAVYDAEADATNVTTHVAPDVAANVATHEPGRSGGAHHEHREPRERRNLPLLMGGAAVALILLVGAGVGVSKLFGGGGQANNAGATGSAPAGNAGAGSPRPSAASPLPTGALGAMLKGRTTDPRPLTLSEVFRRKTFTVSGVRYVMTKWHATRACTKTVHSAKLVSAMRTGGCNQVLRASFARADGKLAGTIGIANLRSARGATATAKLANATKDAYLQPLPGSGATKTLGKGIAFASAEARGHYVLLSWIQAPNGKAIPKSQRKAATVFGPNVVYGSRLGFALQYRGIAGKPYGT
ncbi:MAG TPA: hypothetical protein VH912_05230 [Streptosporangiaceae bacterium]